MTVKQDARFCIAEIATVGSDKAIAPRSGYMHPANPVSAKIGTVNLEATLCAIVADAYQGNVFLRDGFCRVIGTGRTGNTEIPGVETVSRGFTAWIDDIAPGMRGQRKICQRCSRRV